MKTGIRDRRLFQTLLLLLLTAAVILGFGPAFERLTEQVQLIRPSDVLLLDPGHGGIDGGASSEAGTAEKDINLAIAFCIRDLAEADGWNVVMTRETDVSLGAGQNRSIRSQKTADLIARRNMIRETIPLAAVSIHLNSFKEDRSVRGAQAFYPAGPGEQATLDESKRLAELIQKQLILGIDDGNDREALAKRGVLQFKNPTVPMVIVECGFLSNPEEATLLEREEYQRKLAECIYQGILSYTGKESQPPIEMIDSRG